MKQPYSMFPNGNYLSVNIYDLAVLLHNTWLAARDPDVGHEDCRMTAQEFFGRMGRAQPVLKDDLEHMLWASQLLDEKKRFWHPRHKSVAEFARSAFPKHEFDTRLCLLSAAERQK